MALEELARQVATLATVARAAGASAEEIRERAPESAGVAMMLSATRRAGGPADHPRLPDELPVGAR